MALTLCVLLWAVPGNEALLEQYEDLALDRLAPYGAHVVARVRATGTGAATDGATPPPYEVQILEFPSDDALDAFMGDPIRVGASDLRDRAIARTDISRVDPIDAVDPSDAVEASPDR